tara:strand:+ start:1579 stop:1815 length:237 start_codon:yes stop_codon:yes gene_type:complete
MHGQTARSQNSVTMPEEKGKDGKETKYETKKSYFEGMEVFRYVANGTMHAGHCKGVHNHPEYSGQVVFAQQSGTILKV